MVIAPTGYNPNSSKKKEKHQAANYSEAWVEFLDKSVAKTVAKMLNAQVIGGKKGDKWVFPFLPICHLCRVEDRQADHGIIGGGMIFGQ